MKIGFLVGSLRKESFNRKVAKEVETMFPSDVEISWLEIGDLPFYNQDLDTPENEPESWARFRKEATEMDGFLFFEPEYNRSISAVMKNAVDVGSRGDNVWKGKFGGVISATWGAAGGMLANHALRQTFTYNDLTMLAWPEVYLGGVQNMFEGDKFVPGTYDFVKGFVDKFVEFGKKLTK